MQRLVSANDMARCYLEAALKDLKEPYHLRDLESVKQNIVLALHEIKISLLVNLICD